MDPEQFRQLIGALNGVASALQMERGFTFEQVITLLSMAAGGIVFLGIVAWGIVRWVSENFDRRDSIRDGVVEALREEIESERVKREQDNQLLHTRQSNARKEMVDLREYDKDIKRFEGGNDRIVEAIDKLATSIRHDLNSQRQAVGNVVAIQEQVGIRIKELSERVAQMGRLHPAGAE